MKKRKGKTSGPGNNEENGAVVKSGGCFKCEGSDIYGSEVLCEECRKPLADDFLLNLNFIYVFTLMAMFANMLLIFPSVMPTLRELLDFPAEAGPTLQWAALGTLLVFVLLFIFQFIKIRNVAIHPNNVRFTLYYLMTMLGPLGLIYSIHTLGLHSGKAMFGLILIFLSVIAALWLRSYFKSLRWPRVTVHLLGSAGLMWVLTRSALGLGHPGTNWFVQHPGIAFIGLGVFFVGVVLISQKQDLISKTFGYYSIWTFGLCLNFVYFLLYLSLGRDLGLTGELSILAVGVNTLFMISGLFHYAIKRTMDVGLRKDIEIMRMHILNSYGYMNDDEPYYSLKAIDLSLEHNPLTRIAGPVSGGLIENLMRTYGTGEPPRRAGSSLSREKAILERYSHIMPDISGCRMKKGDGRDNGGDYAPAPGETIPEDARKNGGKDTDMKDEMDAGMEAEMDAGMKDEMDAGMEAEMDAGMEAEMDAPMDTGRNAEADAEMEAGMNTGKNDGREIDEKFEGAELIWLKKAEMAVKDGEIDNAVRFYREAIRTNIGYGASWVELGNLYASIKGREHDAERCHDFVLYLKSRAIDNWVEKRLPLRYVTWLIVSYYFYELSLRQKRRLQISISEDHDLNEAEKLYGKRAFSRSTETGKEIEDNRGKKFAGEPIGHIDEADRIKIVRKRRKIRENKGRYRGAGFGRPMSYREAWEDSEADMDWTDEEDIEWKGESCLSEKKGMEWF